jgi:hypothetical protein
MVMALVVVTAIGGLVACGWGHLATPYGKTANLRAHSAMQDRLCRLFGHHKWWRLMCSADAFKSDHVIREVYVAGDNKKPFIMFLIRPNFHMMFFTLFWISSHLDPVLTS